MKTLAYAALATLSVLAAAQPARAVPLSSNPTITNGGLTFSDFTCTRTASGAANAGTCGTLDVSAFGTGIEFAGSLMVAGDSAASGSNLDLLISYRAAATAPATISGVGLAFNGSVTGPGIARAEVVESAFADAARTVSLGQTTVYAPGGPLTGSLAFNPSRAEVFLVKDIALTAFGAGGVNVASVSFVDQTFNTAGGPTPPQPPANVPEPASLALLGLGLAGLGMVRRRTA